MIQIRRLLPGAVIALTLAHALAVSVARGSEAPNVFFSCAGECYDAYLKQELSYFRVVRDRHQADVHLIVSRQAAGNGGDRFTVRAVWTEAAGEKYHLLDTSRQDAFIVPPAATSEEAREALAQAVLRLLYDALRNSPRRLDFELRTPERSASALSRVSDPWNYFVLVPELMAQGEGGSGYYYADATAALTIRRTTEPWRLRVRGSYTRDVSGFELEDGSKIRASIPSWEARMLSAHALGRHWALGGLLSTWGGQFENYQLHVHGGPGVEFNVFPYKQNASRQLRFVYQVGAWWNRYLEVNPEGHLEEVRPYHALSLVADVNQGWGSVQGAIQGNQFLNDPTLFRVSTGVTLSLRLIEGLSFVLEANFAWIEDLINLRRRTITDEELLLWTAQQPTTYTFEGNVGLAYTFGSHHNNIVNPRFGRVDLDEE